MGCSREGITSRQLSRLQRIAIGDDRRPAGNNCLHPIFRRSVLIDIGLFCDARLLQTEGNVCLTFRSTRVVPLAAWSYSESDRIELVVEVIAVDRGDGALFLRKVRNLHLHLRLARANDENGIVGQIDSRHEDVVVLFAEFLVVDSRRDALPVGERAASEQNRCDDDEATFHDHAARVFKSPACIIRSLSPFAVCRIRPRQTANG